MCIMRFFLFLCLPSPNTSGNSMINGNLLKTKVTVMPLLMLLLGFVVISVWNVFADTFLDWDEMECTQ